MSQDLPQATRALIASLLKKPTEGLSTAALQSLVQAGIAVEHEMRRQSHGGHSTLALNSLLGIERELLARGAAQ